MPYLEIRYGLDRRLLAARAGIGGGTQAERMRMVEDEA